MRECLAQALWYGMNLTEKNADLLKLHGCTGKALIYQISGGFNLDFGVFVYIQVILQVSFSSQPTYE